MKSDTALLVAWRQGDESAGRALVERYLPAIRRFIRSTALDDAEELIQRTFMSCVAARDKIDEGQSFRGYLFAIARNEVYAHYRRSRRQPLELDKDCVEELARTPSMVIGQSQDERLLLRALRRLPIDLQVTVELWYWADLDTRELAQALGIPTGTVSSRLARARDRLRELIAKGSADPSWLASTNDNLDRWARSMRAKSPLVSEPAESAPSD